MEFELHVNEVKTRIGFSVDFANFLKIDDKLPISYKNLKIDHK